jgi:hypothetical protein
MHQYFKCEGERVNLYFPEVACDDVSKISLGSLSSCQAPQPLACCSTDTTNRDYAEYVLHQSEGD